MDGRSEKDRLRLVVGELRRRAEEIPGEGASGTVSSSVVRAGEVAQALDSVLYAAARWYRSHASDLYDMRESESEPPTVQLREVRENLGVAREFLQLVLVHIERAATHADPLELRAD